MILIYFSYPDNAGLCDDFDFWNDSRICYKCNENHISYCGYGAGPSFARQCSIYNTTKTVKELGDDCKHFIFSLSSGDESNPNCPNRPNFDSELCEAPDFYCQTSKTCIKKNNICDGILHCIKGEDESLEACLDVFDERFNKSARVICLEANRTSNDFWIKAIPCNGIVECKNGIDEGWWICNISSVCICSSSGCRAESIASNQS